MENKNKWVAIASKESVNNTVIALRKNGIDSFVVKNKEEAKEKVLSLIPLGSEVMTMSSVTLDLAGISVEINESNKYNSVKSKLYAQDNKISKRELKKLGAAPEYMISSVHAITENGEIVIASNTGSQIPAQAYGSDKVIFVVGTQKIVKNIDEGMKRLNEYTLPLESERARKAYGVTKSNISKLLIINKEVTSERIKVVFVEENIGY